jgi:hypothetical protein
MANRKPWSGSGAFGLALASVLCGCSADRTTRETTFEGSWSPADVDLFPGCSLSIENPTTRERVAIEVAEDGRVHAERSTGGRTVAVDAESFEALRRDHPEFVDALRAVRIDYRFHAQFTTAVERG